MRDQVATTIEAIRPALQADGGDIVLHSVEEADSLVMVELTGACVGCPSSDTTLKVGVERILRDRVDAAIRVVNVADAVDPRPQRASPDPA